VVELVHAARQLGDVGKGAVALGATVVFLGDLSPAVVLGRGMLSAKRRQRDNERGGEDGFRSYSDVLSVVDGWEIWSYNTFISPR
jgi:hypothetical protein